MSHTGWSTGAADPSQEGEAALNPQTRHRTDAAEAAPQGNGIGNNPEHEHEEVHAPKEEVVVAVRERRLRIRNETRFGIAALLSFLILVTVLFLNRDRLRGKGPALPIAKIEPAVGRSKVADAPPTPTSTPTPAPDEASALAVMEAKPFPETPPAPDPVTRKPSPKANGTATGTTSSELVMLTKGEKDGEPALPTSSPASDPTSPREPVPTPSPAPPEPTPTPLPPNSNATTSPPPAPAAPPATTPNDPGPAPTTAPTVQPAAPAADLTAPAPAPVAEPNPAPGPMTALAPTDSNLGPDPNPAPPPKPEPAGTPPIDPNGALPPVSAPAADPAPLAAPTVVEPAPAPATAPAPTPEPPPTGPKPVEVPASVALPNTSGPAAAAPLTAPPADVPTLSPTPEPTPAPIAKPAPAPTAPTAWVPLPNVGRRRVLDDDERLAVEPPAETFNPPSLLVDRDPQAPSKTKSVARPSKRNTSPEQVEPVAHVVQRGENFWTISRLYYGYGRFWKALWAANKATVPFPEAITINQTIRIPPPEALDPSLIVPERSPGATASQDTNPRSNASPTSGSTLRRASRATSKAAAAASRGEVEIELPTSDPFARRRDSAPPDFADDEEAVAAEPSPPRRTRYKVRPYETLRSIARDTLGDSRRDGELLDLNSKVIDDPAHLIPGQVIELPADAKVGLGRTRRER